MPGAQNLPSANLVSQEGKLLAPADLERVFEAAGIDPAGSHIATCGSGVTAAIVALALAVIGNDDVAIYDGAWAEWGRQTNDPDDFPVDAN